MANKKSDAMKFAKLEREHNRKVVQAKNKAERLAKKRGESERPEIGFDELLKGV